MAPQNETVSLRAGSSDRRNDLASKLNLRHGLLRVGKTKIGVVVVHGNVKKNKKNSGLVYFFWFALKA